MRKDVILAGKNFFVFNKEKYNYDDINEIKRIFKSNIKVIILQEELYVKQFSADKNIKNVSKFVNGKIINDLPQNGDILYDFEKKNNIISIYYVKGAKRIEKLVENAKNIEIKPIQFVIKEIVFKVLKYNDLNIRLLTKFNECYYYLEFRNGLFKYGDIGDNLTVMMDYIVKNNYADEIYIESSIIDNISLLDELKIKLVNIEDLINERIYKKQRFYSRKIL